MANTLAAVGVTELSLSSWRWSLLAAGVDLVVVVARCCHRGRRCRFCGRPLPSSSALLALTN